MSLKCVARLSLHNVALVSLVFPTLAVPAAAFLPCRLTSTPVGLIGNSTLAVCVHVSVNACLSRVYPPLTQRWLE